MGWGIESIHGQIGNVCQLHTNVNNTYISYLILLVSRILPYHFNLVPTASAFNICQPYLSHVNHLGVKKPFIYGKLIK